MDGRLRELERRWKESGSIEDEAAWLCQSLRSGTINRERVKLALYCDHQAAILAFGQTVEAPKDLRGWAKTVALEIGGWRVSAWLLHAALSEVYRVWSGSHLLERSGPGACVGRVVYIIKLAADSGYTQILDELNAELTTLIEHHASRELMWDGPEQGFVSYLALRAIEILTLERFGSTGEIVDRCAQAIHRFHRRREELAAVRFILKQAIKDYITVRAFESSGPLTGYPHPLSPMPEFVLRLDVDGPCPQCGEMRYIRPTKGWDSVFCKQHHRSKAPEFKLDLATESIIKSLATANLKRHQA